MTDAELTFHVDRLVRARTDAEWLLVERDLEALAPSIERDTLLRVARLKRAAGRRRN